LTAAKKFNCPECGKKYDSATGLGGHRRQVHGVLGTAPSSIAAREDKLRKLQAAQENPFKCPKCGEAFKNKNLLGLHLLNQHGVKGTAKSSIKARRYREEYLANYKRNESGGLLCPECGEVHSARGMAIHRKQAHGLSAEVQAQMFANNKMVAEIESAAAIPETKIDPLQCPNCDFLATSAVGLRNHRRTQHGVLSMTKNAINLRAYQRRKKVEPAQESHAIEIAPTNGNLGHAEEAHPVASGYTIPDATFALALGRFQGFCQAFSAEFDLPPRHFAARLAELIYHSQVRETPRPRVRMPTL